MKLLARVFLSLLLALPAQAQTPNPTFTTVNVTGRLTHTALVATPVAATMTNGATVTYPTTNSIMTLNVSGTIASGNITLPATVQIASGFIVRIVSTGTVTALTMLPNTGQSIVGSPGTISPVAPVNLYFDGASSTWRVLTAGSGLYNPKAVTITGGTISGATVTGGTISGTPISGSTGAFTTLSATTLTVSGTASGAGFGALFASPADIGTTAPGQAWFTNLNVSGTISGAAFDNIADFASPPALGNVAPNTVNATNLAASGTVSGAGFTARLASPGPIGSTSASTGAFTTLSASGAVSGAGFTTLLTTLLATPPAIGGTTPAAISATSLSALSSVTGQGFIDRFAAPGPIGNVTPSTGAFTNLSASGTLSGAGFTALMASPGAIGSGTPSTGAFTTLSASSTISGSGFTNYLAAPPAIGASVPAAGTFTNLTVTGTISGSAFDNIANFASPPVLGNVSPNTVNATNLVASGTVSGAGFTARLASPGPIGSTSASTGTFTTIDASGAVTFAGTVSGAGVTSLFASPPAIGSTAPGTGAFTTLSASGVSTFTGTNRVGDSDWLTAIINWPMARTSQSVLSPNGRIGVTTASRTSDLDPIAAGTTQITIGNAAFAFADNTGTYPDDYFGAYGYYAEARVYPGTVSTAFGAEFNAINLTGDVVGTPTPYHDLFLAGTHALRLASGGGQSLSPDDALAAISITDNEAKFQAGIIFTNNAITGTDGVTGYGEAIQMARGHMLSWYRQDGSEGVRTSFIASIMDDAAVPPVSLQFQNAGTLFLQNSSNIGFAISHVANSVNGVETVPSATGNRVAVRAIGSDTNVNLALTPRGAGTIITDAALTPAAFAGSVLTMRDNQTLTWINGGGNQIAAITNSVTDPAKITSLTFQDTGAYFYGAGGGILGSFAGVTSGVNYPIFSNAATGNPVLITATGSDTNVPLTISGKGSGIITLNAPSTTNVGDFNTGGLSASGTVSGAGFTARFASPGPIGNTTPSTGAFSTLAATSFTNTGASVLGSGSANLITVNGAAASSSPTIVVSGSDTDVGLTVTLKANGIFSTRRAALSASTLNVDTGGSLRGIFSTTTSTISGTITNGVAANVGFITSNDTASAVGSLDQNLYYVFVGANAGGTGLTGGRIGLGVALALTRGTNTSNTGLFSHFHQGIVSQTQAGIRDAGTMQDSNSHLFGAFVSSELRAGGKYWDEIKVMEGNVAVDEGGSVNYKYGITLVTSSTDAVAGRIDEAFLTLGTKKANATNSTGLRNGISFGGAAGYWGITPGGTMIGAFSTTVEGGSPPAMTAGFGVEFTSVAFTGAAWRSPNATITGDGNIATNGAVSGNTLQTKGAIVAKTATITGVTVLEAGGYTTVPSIVFDSDVGSGATAHVTAMGFTFMREMTTPGTGYTLNDVLTLSLPVDGACSVLPQITVNELSGSGVSDVKITRIGVCETLPTSTTLEFTGGTGTGAQLKAAWGIISVAMDTAGSGYVEHQAPIVSATGASRSARLVATMGSAAAHMTLNTGSTVGIPMATPASAGATCTAGTVTFDTSYVYTCVATNTWRRAASSTW